MTKPIIFLSYSHRDTVWKDRLVSHLRVMERKGDLDIWEPSDIQVGTNWSQEITKAVKKADIAVLLVSPDFLASDFIINQELPALLKRSQEKELVVLPIIVRPSPWSQIPELAQLQFLNTDAQPLDTESEYEIDRSLARIAARITEIAGAIRERSAQTTHTNKTKPSQTSSTTKQDKKRYFISHSKIDGDFAELLQLRLQKEGLNAWIDTDRLSPGVDWREEIDKAIRQSPAIIAVMSPEAKNSEYVTYEWAFAWGCKIPIIPLMLRQTPLHPRLATLQYIDFSSRVSRPWSRLFHELRKYTGKKT